MGNPASTNSFEANEPLLTLAEAARLIQVHPEFLRCDRRRESPRIPALVFGPRTIRYRRRDLLAVRLERGETR